MITICLIYFPFGSGVRVLPASGNIAIWEQGPEKHGRKEERKKKKQVLG